MPRKRPTYSPEFRAEAVRLAKSSSESLPTVARELGITAPTLHRWIEQTRPPRTDPLMPDERSELKQLRREIRRLREERDILKKATAFFAKQSE